MIAALAVVSWASKSAARVSTRESSSWPSSLCLVASSMPDATNLFFNLASEVHKKTRTETVRAHGHTTRNGCVYSISSRNTADHASRSGPAVEFSAPVLAK